MPEVQLEALITAAQQLHEVTKQLKIANELKALELKRMADPSVKAPYEWTTAIDRILKGE